MVRLIAKYGRLYYPGDPKRDDFAVEPGDPVPVLVVYAEGDCDSIPWPITGPEWVERLHTALFDDRERGIIDDEEVLLPDGASAWNDVDKYR